MHQHVGALYWTYIELGSSDGISPAVLEAMLNEHFMHVAPARRLLAGEWSRLDLVFQAFGVDD